MATHVAPKLPKSFWKNLNNQRKAFDALAHERKITDPTDWYKVHTKALLSYHGILTVINNYYNGSLYRALTSLYPEQKFDFWKFVRVPKHFWQDKSSQRQFMDHIEQVLGMRSKEDWYSIDASKVKELGGSSLLHYFGKSLPAALAYIYPEYKWKMWMFKESPSGFWDDIQNQRAFMDWLAGELGIKHFEDWYQVSIQQVRSKGGGGMVSRLYQASLAKALQSIYPEHPWQLWRFQNGRVPSGFFDHDHNAHTFLRWFSEQYGITNMDDWYSVSQIQFDKAGGYSLRAKYGDLSRVLLRYFPQYKWNFLAFKERMPSKAQAYLQRVVQNIFPQDELKTNCRIKNLAYLDTKRDMEFDVYIPKHNLILEYQGEQHYIWSTLCGAADFQSAKDSEKKQACVEAGITLIEIPFWWDRQKSSILATILKHRPDLAPYIDTNSMIGTPISDSIPQKYLKSRTATAPQISKFTKVIDAVIGDPTGWLLCYSKGIQVTWNGKDFTMQLPVDENTVVALKNALPSNVNLGGTLHQEGGVTRFVVTDMPSSQFESNTDQRIKLLQMAATEASRKLSGGIQIETAQFVEIQSKQDLIVQYLKAEEAGATQMVLEPPHFAHADVSSIQLTNYPVEYGQVIRVDPNAIVCKLFNSHDYLIRLPKNSGLLQVKEGSVVTFNYRTLESPSATNVEWQPNMKWSDVEAIKEEKAPVPYVLSLGRASGHFPKCQGCGKWLSDRKQPRIEVKAAYSSPSRPYPHPVKLHLCADSQCIQKAMKLWRSKKVQSVYMPPFLNQIGVPSKLKPMVGSLENVTNMEWVDMM